MSEGWIKLHRSIVDNWVWNDKPFTRGQAFVDLLLDVNHADNKVLINGQLIEVKAGEKITSLNALAERYGWSTGKVKRFLELLEVDGMIDLKTEHLYTLVKVRNYATYQAFDNPKRNTDETQTKHRRNADETRTKPNNNDKNEKNEKNIFITPSVEDVRAYCAERQNGIDAEEFVDFYSAKGWMVGKNKMKDWKAAVRNWERSSFRKPTEKKATSYDINKAKEQAKRKIIYEEN